MTESDHDLDKLGLDALLARDEQWNIEMNLVLTERDALKAEVERLKAIPPTFIKLDETTEALQQAHAAIENMKMFQKDVLLLRSQLERANRWNDENADNAHRFLAERDHWRSLCKRLAEALDTIATAHPADDWQYVAFTAFAEYQQTMRDMAGE